MKKQITSLDEWEVPDKFIPLIRQARAIYDSSSSPQAQVYFIDADQGYFLKRARKTQLKKEADVTTYFFRKVWLKRFWTIYHWRKIGF